MILPPQSPPIQRTATSGENTARNTTITTTNGRTMPLVEAAKRGEATIQYGDNRYFRQARR